MAYKQSISVSEDRVTEEHSLRKGTLPKSVDASLLDRDVYVLAREESYQEQFNQYFAPYIDEYNAKQKRKDRRIDADYYQKLLDGGQVKPINSFVIQIGSKDSTCGITDPTFQPKTWRELKEQDTELASAYVAEHLNTHPNVQTSCDILKEVAARIPEWYPNFVPTSLCIHMDEPCGTPHLDCNGFWVASKGKRGMSKRCAKEAALKEMGYDGKACGSPFKDWQQDFISRVAEVAEEYGIEREFMNSNEKHRSINAFRVEEEKKQAIVELKEIKRRQEVARLVEVEQTERIEELEERKESLQKQITKDEARAERAEDRAEKAEYRLELAREDLQDLRDDIQDLQRIQKVLEEDNEKKKKEASSWEKRIEELQKRFEELKEQVKEYEARLSKLAKAIVQMSWVPELYQHPIKSFLNWLNHKINTAGGDAEPNEIIAHEVLTHTQEDFYRECGQDVQRELRKYVKEHPELATNKEIRAAQNSPETTRDTSFIKSGSSMYIMQ